MGFLRVCTQVLSEGTLLHSLPPICYWSSGDLCADLELRCQKFLLVFTDADLIDSQTHKGALPSAVIDLLTSLLWITHQRETFHCKTPPGIDSVKWGCHHWTNLSYHAIKANWPGLLKVSCAFHDSPGSFYLKFLPRHTAPQGDALTQVLVTVSPFLLDARRIIQKCFAVSILHLSLLIS